MKKVLENFDLNGKSNYLIILNLLILSYYFFISFTPLPDPTHYLVAHLDKEQIEADKLNEIINFIKTPIYLILDIFFKDIFFYTIASLIINLVFLNCLYFIINSFLRNKIVSLIIVSSFVFLKAFLAVLLYFDIHIAETINLLMMNIDILMGFSVRQIFGLLFIFSIYFFLKEKYYICNLIIFLNFFTHPNSNLISASIFLLFYTFMFLKNRKEWFYILLTYIFLLIGGISLKLIQVYTFDAGEINNISSNFYYNSMIKDEADDFSVLWQIAYKFQNILIVSFLIFIINFIYLKIYKFDKLSFLSLSPLMLFIFIGLFEYINTYYHIKFINNLIINTQPGWKLLGYSFIPLIIMFGKIIIKIDLFNKRTANNFFIFLFITTILLFSIFGLTKNYNELARFYSYSLSTNNENYEDWLFNRGKKFYLISTYSKNEKNIISLYPDENNIFKIKELNNKYNSHDYINQNEDYDFINLIKNIKNLVPKKIGIILPPNFFMARGIFKNHYIFFVEHPDGNFAMGNVKFFKEINDRMELMLNTNYNRSPNKQSGLNYSFMRQKFNQINMTDLIKIKKNYPKYQYILSENKNLKGAKKIYNDELFALYKF